MFFFMTFLSSHQHNRVAPCGAPSLDSTTVQPSAVVGAGRVGCELSVLWVAQRNSGVGALLGWS